MLLGIDKQATIIAVFLLFSVSAKGQGGKSYKYHLGSGLEKSIVISGNQSILINYSIPEINVRNIVNEQGSFFRISIPDHNSTSTPGQPELPVFSRLINLPEGSEYKIKISEVVSSRLKPSGKNIDGILYPAQEGETKGE